MKDSPGFVQKINGIENVPGNCILVIMDVRSLYNNISNNEGLKAIETTLKRKNIFNSNYHADTISSSFK